MNPTQNPLGFLQHLYDVAVRRALPLHNTAAFLPLPPKGRTLVLGAARPVVPWRRRWKPCGLPMRRSRVWW